MILKEGEYMGRRSLIRELLWIFRVFSCNLLGTDLGRGKGVRS